MFSSQMIKSSASTWNSAFVEVKDLILIYYSYNMVIKMGQKFQPVSGTDALAAKRIEKLNDSEKKSC